MATDLTPNLFEANTAPCSDLQFVPYSELNQEPPHISKTDMENIINVQISCSLASSQRPSEQMMQYGSIRSEGRGAVEVGHFYPNQEELEYWECQQ